MSRARYEALVAGLCEAIGLPSPEAVLERGWVEVEGFEVLLGHYANDDAALYLNFHFGIVTVGRTLQVFKLMLEANLTVYAQDQAQLGLHPDNEGIVLIVRVPMADDIDGTWLAETLAHYAEHGRYWADHIVNASEQAFNGVCAGDYLWINA